ncbi:MAG: single-stranded DNA-binding protein [Cytophagales bacterium]|nr:single-stranded DNA-binding protein [Cytophagales bacterium]
MNSLRNRVQLIGRLGADPETRQVNGDRTLTKFTMATNETFRNSAGEKIEETQWHNVVAWGKIGEIAGKYLKKGSEVAIEGKLIHRVYENNGEKKYFTEISMNEMVMVGGKN